MLTGSVAGGVIAQFSNLGVPYAVRAAMLGVTLVVAWRFMRDIGFTPERGVTTAKAVRNVVSGALDGGLRNPPVRWLMLASPFVTGVGFYAFYAFQPYLLELYGDPNAYSIAGLAAAIVAGAQIAGGLLVPWVRRLFTRRTHAIILAGVVNVALLALIGWIPSFWLAIALLATWAMIFATVGPMRQAFINGVIPSEQRATVLSFDSFMGSGGGVVIQPALGRVADVYGYGASYVVSGAIQALAIPFAILARRENAPSDPIRGEPDEADAEAAATPPA
jgi:MFS family permease